MLPIIIALSNLIYKLILVNINKKIDANSHINLFIIVVSHIHGNNTYTGFVHPLNLFPQKSLSNLSYPFLGRMYLLQMHNGFLLYTICLHKVKEIINLRPAKIKISSSFYIVQILLLQNEQLHILQRDILHYELQ